MRRTVWLLSGMLAIPPGVAAGESFQDWMESRNREVQAFREERDRAFHGFLEEQWEAFDVYQGEREDDTPKPRRIPEAPSGESESKPEPEPEPVEEAGGGSEPMPGPLTVEPRAVEPPPPQPDDEETERAGPGSDIGSETGSEPAREPPSRQPPEESRSQPDGEETAFRFLGHELRVSIPAAWQAARVSRANESGIADFWAEFAGADAAPVVRQLSGLRERLRLNGWGYLQLVQALSRSVHGEGDSAAALTWALMLKSGYDIRAAHDGSEVLLLFRPARQLFGVPYFDLDGDRYYLLGHDGGAIPRIRTYRADYQGADRDVSVALRESPRAGGQVAQREIAVEYRGDRHRFQVPVPKALVEYLRTVPQQSVGAYFKARPVALEEHLVEPLQEVTAGMEQGSQVDFLLRLVQTAFNYQTDQEQFGREDYLYPEETLYYPASDCEDRSVLFAWLVREVLGLEVAALDYPGHVATAVGLQGGEGVRVEIDGRALMVADPTYLNARAGMVMPEYRDQRPEVIPLW